MTATATVEATTERGKRDRRICTVVARSGDKTIRARFEFLSRHRKYGKFLRRSTMLHAHDEKNEASVGDLVELAECRRYSKMKSWRLVRIVRSDAQPGA
ncbi:MAG: 30S ribosomal protein S17 [Phycisphaerae bacterium]|nr:30S ribosomal protein S17 [Phycisphaerae bacterium]